MTIGEKKKSISPIYPEESYFSNGSNIKLKAPAIKLYILAPIIKGISGSLSINGVSLGYSNPVIVIYIAERIPHNPPTIIEVINLTRCFLRNPIS